MTVMWAFCCIFLVPKSFETAYFLNDDEKALMRQRVHRTQAYSDSECSGHYCKADVKEAAKDIKSWVHGFIQIAVVKILYGFGTFLPIIIRNGFNFSTKQVCKYFIRFWVSSTHMRKAQYLVIPVNIWGVIVYAIGAYLSDHYQTRFLPLILMAPIGIAGYALRFLLTFAMLLSKVVHRLLNCIDVIKYENRTLHTRMQDLLSERHRDAHLLKWRKEAVRMFEKQDKEREKILKDLQRSLKEHEQRYVLLGELKNIADQIFTSMEKLVAGIDIMVDKERMQQEAELETSRDDNGKDKQD
ncbi:retrograde regulation protein 2 [Stemphylium lycopersici]|nr:retrograde regulation protein 2 [Stemphylium lycopersici]